MVRTKDELSFAGTVEPAWRGAQTTAPSSSPPPLIAHGSSRSSVTGDGHFYPAYRAHALISTGQHSGG
jgi:hypothetical protein